MIQKNTGKYWLCCLFTACLTLWASSAFADDSPCEEGKQECMGNTRYECTNHRWKLVEECHKPASCYAHYNDEGKITAECTHAEPCKDGEYTCFGGVFCRSRADLNCHDYDKEMYKCQNGHWEFVKTCPDEQVCEIGNSGKAKCKTLERDDVFPLINTSGGCYSGSYKCDGNAVMACNMGIWVFDKICNDEEVCKSTSEMKAKCVNPNSPDDNRTTKAKHCKNGESLCFGAEEMYQCNDGQWQLVTKCPGACELQKDGKAKCVSRNPNM